MLICLTAENNINNIILLLTIEKMKIIWYNLSVMWRGARVVERGGLENRYVLVGHRGFESLSLRQIFYRQLFSRLFALALAGLKSPVFIGFPELYSVVRPVPHFLHFRYFALKISVFTLSISDTCETLRVKVRMSSNPLFT